MISSHLWWNMMEVNVKKTVYIYMCVCVCDCITLMYSIKLTEHCKSSIIEKKNLKKLNKIKFLIHILKKS